MDSKVKFFVEKYNEKMNWNREILKSLSINLKDYGKDLQYFLEYNFSTEDITGDKFDLKHAKVYEYEDTGTSEMQVFNNKTYGTTYFWCKLVQSKNEYIKQRIKETIFELNKYIEDEKIKIDELISEFDDKIALREKFNNYEQKIDK